MPPSLRAALLLGVLALPLPARAADLSLTGGTIRLILPTTPAAGYFDLRNDGAAPRTLTGASSPGCGSLMLHRSVMSGATSRMEMVESVPVPPHSTLRFAPGGYHLMCMNLAPTLKPGASTPVTLSFAGGEALTAPFAVVGVGK